MNFFDGKKYNFENKILKLDLKLTEKEEEIKSLKSAFPFEIKTGEKLMSIIISSADQIIKNTKHVYKLRKNAI